MAYSKIHSIIQDLINKHLCFQTTITNKEQIIKLSNKKFYFGIDPSSRNIHLGHIINLMLAYELHSIGMQMILLIGSFTGRIGDPSLKSETRKTIGEKQIQEYSLSICKTMKVILNKLGIKYDILYNCHWLQNLSFAEYVEISKVFNIKTILNSKIFAKRLQEKNPMYMHEIIYFTMQSYDFFYLNKNYNCNLQIGGQDQWINMTSGCTLIKKYTNSDCHVITTPLITDQNGEKISKTSKNAHTYSFNQDKFFTYNYVNFCKLDKKIIALFSQILNCNNCNDTLKRLFTLFYSDKEYNLMFILINYFQNKDKNQNMEQIESKRLMLEYNDCLDIYYTNNYNVKAIIKRFTNIEKSHHINDIINSGSIVLNMKNIKNIREFYNYTIIGLNYISISDYFYIYIYYSSSLKSE